MNNAPQDKLLSIQEFLEFIGVPEASEQGVRHQIWQGCLKVVRINGRLLIPESEAASWMNRHKVKMVNKRLDIIHMYHEVTNKRPHRSETAQPSLLKKEVPMTPAEKSAKVWNDQFTRLTRLEAKVDKLLVMWEGK